MFELPEDTFELDVTAARRYLRCGHVIDFEVWVTTVFFVDEEQCADWDDGLEQTEHHERTGTLRSEGELDTLLADCKSKSVKGELGTGTFYFARLIYRMPS